MRVPDNGDRRRLENRRHIFGGVLPVYCKKGETGMIRSGTVYVIASDFEATLEFYRQLLEREAAAQNKTRFAVFQVGGLELSVMNAHFDVCHPEQVSTKGRIYPAYDDLARIAGRENPGKIVINLCTDDLKGEHRRIRELGIGSELTEIRCVNARSPYWYFCLRDPDGNTVEIAGNYEESTEEGPDAQSCDRAGTAGN